MQTEQRNWLIPILALAAVAWVVFNNGSILPNSGPPSPFKADGFRVLIVEEKTDGRSTMPPEQVNAIHSKKLRDYLKQNCVKVNEHPEYRILDKDSSMDKMSDVWKQVWADHIKTATKFPLLVVGNGDTGFVGECPVSLEEILSLCDKYDGE